MKRWQPLTLSATDVDGDYDHAEMLDPSVAIEDAAGAVQTSPSTSTTTPSPLGLFIAGGQILFAFRRPLLCALLDDAVVSAYLLFLSGNFSRPRRIPRAFFFGRGKRCRSKRSLMRSVREWAFHLSLSSLVL